VRVSALRILFPLGLAFSCLSQAHAGVTTGSTKHCVPTQDADGTWSCYTPTPVGPGPGGGDGTPISPNDYGMCGLLSLSGNFNNSSAAEIVVRNGYYTVFTRGKTKFDLPVVDYTCVYFTDFTGLPPNSEGEANQSPTETASPGPVMAAIGNNQQACIWAGVAGGFTQFNFATAQFLGGTKGQTEVEAETNPGTTLSTYAFCSTFKTTSPTWTKWTYLKDAFWYGDADTGGKTLNLSIPKSEYWCYMDGVLEKAEPFSAALVIGATDYEEKISSSDMAYNCLPFKQ
jgi:hypothetical protein